MKPVEANANFVCHLETSKSHRFFMFLGCKKGDINPKCVKQQQYRREGHNLMLLA